MISGYPAGGRDGKQATEREVYGIEPDELPDDFHRLEETKMSNAKNSDNPKSVKRLVMKDKRGLEILDEVMDDDVDYLAFGTQITDHLGHLFFKGVKPEDDRDLLDLDEEERDFATSRHCRGGYSAVDELIQAVIDKYDPSYIWAIGDHGFLRHDDGHSMRTALIEYRKDEDPDLSDAGCITDLRSIIRDRLDLPWIRESYSGETDTEVTEEEMEQVEDKLEELGYL
jgi:hypothetical protein